MKIKKGDTVEVIAGKDRGKRGEVLRVLPAKNRVIVQALNLRKKHQRGGQNASGRQTTPEIVTFEGSMNASNVMLICPKCGERVRVRSQRSETGKPQRVCPECENVFGA
jgi:large subunit ribosomal protein L24